MFGFSLKLCILCLCLMAILSGCRVMTLPIQWPSAQPEATSDDEIQESETVLDMTDAANEGRGEAALGEAVPPVSLEIAELGLALPITTMGWVVTEENGTRTTSWIVPTDAIGWHANSARAGAAGNLILSAHQAMGDALFAPLALGDIQVGQEVLLTDSNDAQFLYRITEISEPIPVLGATEEDNALARSYLQPSETPILTMMTGWPDFTTTHRIFAVAEYVAETN